MTETSGHGSISRRRVAEKALGLLDEVGVEGFNIRRLGTALGVNGASLYYHYPSKSEILEDVTRYVLSSLRLPDPSSDDWLDWLVECNLNYRDILLSHPNVIPLILKGNPGRYRPSSVEDYLAQCFENTGHSPDDIKWILEVVEAFAIGLVLVARSGIDIPGEVGPARNDTQFRSICRGLIELLVRTGKPTKEDK
jgi:AcrR family transcriptional regulator